MIGTVDLKKGIWVAVNNNVRAAVTFPEGVRPIAEISFPRANGGPPIQQRVVLTEMCCAVLFGYSPPKPFGAGVNGSSRLSIAHTSAAGWTSSFEAPLTTSRSSWR